MALDDIRITQRCRMPWGEMSGDDTTRKCDRCSLKVYNFANLTRDEAETLIRKTEGRLCGRIYRRFDGSVMTRDCPNPYIPASTSMMLACFALMLIVPVMMAFVNDDFRFFIARYLPQPVAEIIRPEHYTTGLVGISSSNTNSPKS